MAQEEKELLLKDLSARLPYKVICTDSRHGDSRITEIDIIDETVYCDDFDEYVELNKCKPYLRPMSNMTDEEWKEYRDINCCLTKDCDAWDEVDWLNAHHFDYRELIDKGLALEAPDGMYNLEKK